MQLMGIDITRESLVKIERGIQHIYATQLKGIKEILDTSYDELLKWFWTSGWFSVRFQYALKYKGLILKIYFAVAVAIEEEMNK